MNKIITILLLLNAFTGLCQTKTPGKWKIGLTFSSDNYLHATSIPMGQYTGYHLAPSGPNYTPGLMGLFALKRKLDLGTGATYFKKEYTGTYYCHTCDFLVMVKPEPIKQSYLEVPLFARYYIFDKKLDLHIEAGLTGGFLTRDIDTKYAQDPWFGNKFLISQQIGLGGNLDLGQRIHLSFTAFYKSSFTKSPDDTDFKLHAFGLITGLWYKL
jgi:hypothetical protein